MSIFYTEVSKDVQSALTNRKSYYGSTNRNSDAHAWLYKKTAYVTATAYNPKTDAGKSLEVPTAGGLGADSLYTSNSNANFIPKPHINSVKISSDGDFGSLKKCEVAFTVYTLTDLNNCQPFFDIGASLVVNYGWSIINSGTGKTGKFEGIIYNFSYTVNNSGGFDCVAYGVAKGATILPINITAGTEPDSLTTDQLDSRKVSVNLMDILQQLANKNRTYQGYIDSEGVGYDYLADDNNSINNKLLLLSSEQKFYITLEKLISLINRNLLKDVIEVANATPLQANWRFPEAIKNDAQTPPTFDFYKFLTESNKTNNTKTIEEKDFIIICNGEYTKGLIPDLSTDLISANPLQMIFPGFSTYGGQTYFKNAVEEIKQFKAGDISKTLLSINWLKSLFYEIGLETQDRQKSADQSITKFLINIFNAISVNSGTRFKLSLTSMPEDKNPDGKKFVISDVNYIDKKITPYVLTAVNNQGICRSISLTSRVPTAMAATAYIASRSTAVTQGAVAGSVLTGKKLPDNTNVKQQSREALKNVLQTFSAGQLNNSENIASLQIALKTVYETAEQKNTSGGLNSLPYPIDFSATLDGIEGFQFGNTVTTNYLPAVYQNNRVAFTVTKIDHTIQNNDWTTTVATICRLLTDNQNKSDSTAENEYKNIQGNIENSGITYQGNTSATTTTRTNVTTAIQ
jgi:hypothetical protein